MEMRRQRRSPLSLTNTESLHVPMVELMKNICIVSASSLTVQSNVIHISKKRQFGKPVEILIKDPRTHLLFLKFAFACHFESRMWCENRQCEKNR
jgi:hypothetical protein